MFLTENMVQTKNVENLGRIMGSVGSGVFEAWPILENKSQDILANAASILTILSKVPTWFKTVMLLRFQYFSPSYQSTTTLYANGHLLLMQRVQQFVWSSSSHIALHVGIH